MSQDDVLLQEEIDALLHSVSGKAPEGPDQTSVQSRFRAYDPATQHRVIRDRLHALDIINARFARLFRISLFNLIRRNADITVESMRYQSFSNFSRNVPVPTNVNLIAMKPLRGSALVVFPPNLIFMVVDNLFGGDGSFLTKSEGREFTNTEQRIIARLLSLVTDAFQESWHSIYPLQISYLRSEMQVKFANITNSPNEIIVNTSFHLEVGNLRSDFQICIPYSMIEPIREILTNPVIDSHGKKDRTWTRRMAGEIQQSEVELVADFVTIPARINSVLALKVGDILPIKLPDIVNVRVDGVPVMRCEYGGHQERRALRVVNIIDHSIAAFTPGQRGPATVFQAEESDNDEIQKN